MNIEHDAAAGRFHTTVDGHEAECVYRLSGGTMVFTHTEVPPAVEGRGIAAALVAAALAHARAHGLKVRPLCSYVRHYLRRHREEADLLEAGA